MQKKILVTGSTGFVGTELCYELQNTEYFISNTVRDCSKLISGLDNIVIPSFSSDTDWSDALEGCDTIIHLAARAHILNDSCSDPLSAFRLTNTSATLNLAEQAAACGVSRFIFLSSIGVNGSKTDQKIFHYNDSPSPHSPYAVSKFEAEIGLREISERTNLDVVIIRSPAIYGRNAPGNFGLLTKCIRYGLPIPVGSILNKRSLVSVENIVSFIIACIDHKAAANELFLISDGEDLSTIQLLNVLGKLVGKKPVIFKFSLKLLRFLFMYLGKLKAGESLMENLQLDSKRSRDLLNWTPPFSPKTLIKKLD
ncbi:NAD-dependent epimerase/dehydratase family protein [Gammaproteobacteria bacterium]|nr:NAD-dependent epimerase/dehydratase family protein [Gammaproteobacteria bacterium]MDB4242866.1 NAD-dependent epimerase/dehydratase family protein [Gammaproteobacteria bacterium]